MPVKDKIKVVKSRTGVKDKLIHHVEERADGIIKVKTPRREYTLSVGDITANEAIEKVKKEHPTFQEFEYKTITYKKTGKDGEFIKRIDPPEKIEQRWQKKKDHIRELSDNVSRLKNRITRDLKSDDEKDCYMALIISIMLHTGERIGNSASATYEKTSKKDKRQKAFGVSVFLKKHATIIGNKIHFDYIGKKGVPQDKSFSDEKVAKALKRAIKNSPNEFIFTTSEGQPVNDVLVNKYLKPFNISCKAVRGYSANKWVLDKLKNTTPEDTDKKRKKQLSIILKKVAEKVGHGPSVLKNQYLMPEVITSWVDKGEVFDIKEAGYVMKEGGEIKSEKKPKETPNKKNILFGPRFDRVITVEAKPKPITPDDLAVYEKGSTPLKTLPITRGFKEGGESALENLNVIYSKPFKTFFGDWENNSKNASKIVDNGGFPLILYHGANEDFSIFDTSNKPAWFTPIKKEAKWYASDRIKRKNGKIIKVFLNITNPLDLYNSGYDNAIDDINISELEKISGIRISEDKKGDVERKMPMWILLENKIFIDEVKNAGYDGIIVKEDYSKHYAAFYPNQIKLAEGNTIFDSNNPDIRFEKGGEIGGNYSFKNDYGSFTSIKVMPVDQYFQACNDCFTVEITVRYKGEDGQIRITKPKYKTFPISEYKKYMEDLKNRGADIKLKEGGKLVGKSKEIIAKYYDKLVHAIVLIKEEIADQGPSKEGMLKDLLLGAQDKLQTLVMHVPDLLHQAQSLKLVHFDNGGIVDIEDVNKLQDDTKEMSDEEVVKLYPIFFDGKEIGKNKITSDVRKELANHIFESTKKLDIVENIVKEGEVKLEKGSKILAKKSDVIYSDAFKSWFGDWQNDPKKSSKVVDKSGKPLKVYHGTKAVRFTEFDMNKLGEGIDQYGSGFYFSNQKDISEGYGENVYEVYLDIKNPIDHKKTLTYNEIKKIIIKSPNLKDSLYNFGDVDYEGQSKVLDQAVKGYVDYGDDIMFPLNAISNDFYKGEEQHFLKAVKDVLGFDGNIVKHNAESTIYVAFFPTQIKLADGSNVTFDKKNPDIRFENGGNISGEAFKRWFNKSKVINKNYTPKIVYHGTGSKFNKFNIKKTTQGIIWFTSSKEDIEKGEVGAQGKGYIMELYASIQNPAGWNEYEKYGLGQLKGLGYDGAILPDKDGNFVGFVFQPTQLKSATDNKGTFDPNNSDIRLENGGNLSNNENFANAKNNRIFIPSNITKDEINKVISGTRAVTNGTVIQAASSYLRRSQSASSLDRSSYFKGQEEERLRQYISENNLWVPFPNPENKFAEGGEAKVYLSDGFHVIKINDSPFYASWEDYLNSLLLHNLFFPITSYELIGFSEYKDFDERILYAIVKQSFIRATTHTNLEVVKDFLINNGFINKKNHDYYHPDLGIILEDLHEGNVLTQDGLIYFIDTIFYINPNVNYNNGRSITQSDVDKTVEQKEVVNSLGELKNQVLEAKNINEFLKNIITDYDLRYKYRKAAEPLVVFEKISLIDSIKPYQAVNQDTIKRWQESIKEGAKPFVIIRDDNTIDGNHKLQAYKNLGFTEVPVLWEKDLKSFYYENKSNSKLAERGRTNIIKEREILAHGGITKYREYLENRKKNAIRTNDYTDEQLIDFFERMSKLGNMSKEKNDGKLIHRIIDMPNELEEGGSTSKKLVNKYYKIEYKSLDQFKQFLRELKLLVESADIFFGGIGEAYLKIRGHYETGYYLYEEAPLDFHSLISQTFFNYKSLRAVPQPENRWNGEWKTLDETLEFLGDKKVGGIIKAREELSKQKELTGKTTEVINYFPAHLKNLLSDKSEKNVLENRGGIFNENLSYLLSDKGQTTHIGPETGFKVDNGITIYKSDHGSYRYVKYIDGIPVSAIQVMSRDGINGYVTNAYTANDYRRQGHGMDIIRKIKNDFKNVVLSSDLSGSGKLFKQKVSSTVHNIVPPGRIEDTEKKERGGLVVGARHDDGPNWGQNGGGVPFTISDTNEHIEEEGLEANIPREITEDTKEYSFTGANHEVLDEILKLKGGKGLSAKVTHVKSGDIVICIKSVWDDTKRTYKGTLTQILSAINTSNGCKVIEPGAKVIEGGKTGAMDRGGIIMEREKLARMNPIMRREYLARKK